MAPSAIATTIDDYPASLTHFNDKNILTYRDDRLLAKRLVGEAFESRVKGIDGDTCEAGDEDAFFVADLGEVYRQHMRWKKNLGRVKPHYGMPAL